MPRPRKCQISLDATPYYHCVSRCVRRAFLCGVDHHSGKSYEHRREWVEQRLLELAPVFAIDIAAYAVMSNHLHVVLHINAAEAHSLTPRAICERWHQLYQGTPLSHRFLKGEALTEAEQQVLDVHLAEWRRRLADISWFMRCLNEPIARRANAEDGCAGRFWEGRFKSQALLDEKALAACMAYVDLNPIRAGMADTPEHSDHTSVQRRIRQLKAFDPDAAPTPEALYPFAGNPREPMPEGIPFRLADYLALVEWSGRQLHPHKRGAIDEAAPPLLERLGIEPDNWLKLTQRFEALLPSWAGAPSAFDEAGPSLHYRRKRGTSANKALFG